MPVSATLLSFVRRSKRRKQILGLLSKERLTAADITKRTGMYKSHVARTIKELDKKKLLVCENPRDEVYKYYKLSRLGKEIILELSKFT